MKAEQAKKRKGGRKGRDREWDRGREGGCRAKQQGPRQKQKRKQKLIFNWQQGNNVFILSLTEISCSERRGSNKKSFQAFVSDDVKGPLLD